MSVREIEERYCDSCDRSPNGMSPDCIYCYRCEHDICNECQWSIHKEHPEVKFPMAWCPKCNKVVETAYA